MLDHLEQAWIGAEEVLPEICSAFYEVLLVLTVADFTHSAYQQAFAIFCQQRIPITAPNDLDDVPTGAAEVGFQFLDDLAVAAHRTIESLQVAIDHEDQIVQLFARCERNCAQCLRLIGFTVAEECPDLAGRTLL